jgi:hypothetical protein
MWKEERRLAMLAASQLVHEVGLDCHQSLSMRYVPFVFFDIELMMPLNCIGSLAVGANRIGVTGDLQMPRSEAFLSLRWSLEAGKRVTITKTSAKPFCSLTKKVE